MLKYYSAKFGGHRHSGSLYVIPFICHVTLQDLMIKALTNFMVSIHSKCFIILPQLVDKSTVVVIR